MAFSAQFLSEVRRIAAELDENAIERLAALLAATRDRGGRLFILGVGGSAANASHAVNDFRKIADIECYAPTDNVSELTARTKDEGWPSVFEAWLRTSRLTSDDTILVLSVGGGSLDAQVSPNIVAALRYAKSVKASNRAPEHGPNARVASSSDAVTWILQYTRCFSLECGSLS